MDCTLFHYRAQLPNKGCADYLIKQGIRGEQSVFVVHNQRTLYSPFNFNVILSLATWRIISNIPGV